MMTKVIFGASIVLILLGLSSNTFAFSYNGLNYDILSSGDRTVAVGKNTSASGSVTVPAEVTYNGTTYTVTKISTEAFKNAPMTSISLPQSLTDIAGDAFINSGLRELIIPNSVLTIGNGSFANCRNLTKLQLGRSVKSIGRDIFTGLSSLREVICLNPTPPSVITWGTTTTSATLYVPMGAVSAYSSATVP